jgi:hypothetical protein
LAPRGDLGGRLSVCTRFSSESRRRRNGRAGVAPLPVGGVQRRARSDHAHVHRSGPGLDPREPQQRPPAADERLPAVGLHPLGAAPVPAVADDRVLRPGHRQGDARRLVQRHADVRGRFQVATVERGTCRPWLSARAPVRQGAGFGFSTRENAPSQISTRTGTRPSRDECSSETAAAVETASFGEGLETASFGEGPGYQNAPSRPMMRRD